MSQLRMLLLQGVTLEGGYEHFPGKLKWLKWSSEALEKFPSSLQLEVFKQLKVLDLSGCRNLSICPDFESMIHLEVLSFDGCVKMSELHPSIGLLQRLTHLFLGGCSSLKEVPQQVWQLTKLEEFYLYSCMEITTFPSFKQHLLGELKALSLSWCLNLTMCPDFMGMLHLEILDFENCEKVSELHPSIGNLKSLINLNLRGCESLKEVPQEVWQLASLKELNLSGCTQITALPSQIWNAESLKQPLLGELKVLKLDQCYNLTKCSDFMGMPHLEILDFEGCKKMSELHPSVGHLKRLTNLNLSGCESLKQVPQEVWQLTSLQELNLHRCKQITALPSQIWNAESLKLSFLERLNMSDCGDLKRCPDFTSMPHLLELSLRGCRKITELDPSIGQLKSLMHLDLSLCESLKELPQEIGQLTSLKSLDLSSCSSLKEVPQEVWKLTSLQELNLSGCTQITALASQIRNDESLKQPLLERLVLDRCINLITCPDFTTMPHLRRLSFNGCRKITKLDPTIWQLKRFMDLDLSYCTSLKELPQAIGQLTSLKWLTLRGCCSLKELPQEVWQLASLQWLDLGQCMQITALPSQIRNTESLKQPLLGELEVLKLDQCYNLTKCPDFMGVPHLKTLDFQYCWNISELHPSIAHLKSLTYLNLSYCESLKELPQEVWQLTLLQELDLHHCNQITALPSQIRNAESLQQPYKLERLNLGYCSNLIVCPDFTSMPHLQKLHFSGCEKITELDPSIGQLERLRYLDLEDCKSLKELPQEIGQLTSLESLELGGCSSLKKVPLLPPSLDALDASHCDQLEIMADVSNLKGLWELSLSGCIRLVDIPGIEQLKCLKRLRLGGCRQLADSLFARVQDLDRLEELELHNWVDLTKRPDVASLLNWLSNLKYLRKLDLSWTDIEEQPALERLRFLSVIHCDRLKSLPWLPPSSTELNAAWCTELSMIGDVSSMDGLTKLNLTGCRKLVHIPGVKQLKRLEKLELAGCRSLHDSFFEGLQEANFQHMQRFSIPGRLINDGLSDPQFITFILPKQFLFGLLCLYVDQRSLDNICSELEKNNGASTLPDKSVASEDEVTQLVDRQLGRLVVRIDITTDDAQFSFLTFVNGWSESRRFPTATFASDSELMMMANQGRFKGNDVDDAQGRGMMEMHVSIDGCILLHGDLLTTEWLVTDKDLDACRVGDNIVQVKFG